MLAEKKKTLEEKLQLMHENNQKVGLYKLESDENGNYLLDPNNKHHREWVEKPEAYEVTDEQED